MMDVVIGVIKEHNWTQIEAYAISLCRSGFAGRKLMMIDGVDRATQQNLSKLGFTVVGVPRPKYQLCAAIDRFYYASEWLKRNPYPYRYAVWTDVRDVVFQTNPSDWLEKNLAPSELIIGSENIRIKDEFLHNFWAKDAYGEQGLREMGNHIAINCGTLAGTGSAVQALCEATYEECNRIRHTGFANTGYKNRDQIAMNRVLWQPPFEDMMRIAWQEQAFAAVCGILSHPERYGDKLLDDPPTLRGNTLVNKKGDAICIVHQYDKRADWKPAILEKYRATRKELS